MTLPTTERNGLRLHLLYLQHSYVTNVLRDLPELGVNLLMFLSDDLFRRNVEPVLSNFDTRTTKPINL